MNFVDLEDIKTTVDHSSAREDAVAARQLLESQRRKEILNKLHVPTDDGDVRARLRLLKEPVTLFAEDKADRRNRLKQLMVDEYEAKNGQLGADEDVEMEDEEDEEFFTPGSQELLEARKAITRDAVARTEARLQRQRQEASLGLVETVAERRKVMQPLDNYTQLGSQFVSTRPASAVAFNSASSQLAAGSWSGEIKIMGVPNLDTRAVLRGHQDKVSAVKWISDDLVVSGCGQGKLLWWNIPGSSSGNAITDGTTANGVGTLTHGSSTAVVSDREVTALASLGNSENNHKDRIACIDIHPSHKWIATASHDYTWGLWDVETRERLLTQEGHSKGVHAVSFHPDGSLLASGGLDAIARVWDLRSGRSIQTLEGHIREIYSLDWSPNGYQLATGSADGSVKIWDLRAQRCVFTIPAHTKIVSHVKFDSTGSFLASTGYDGDLDIWHADSWALAKRFPTLDKIMGLDLGKDNEYFATTGWDNQVKLWCQS